jgi:hypothetical protein
MDKTDREVCAVDIDSDVVKSFLIDRDISPKCTFCCSQDLAVNEVTAAAGFRVGAALGTYINRYGSESYYSPDVNLSFFGLTCQYCGHVMIFDIDNIVQWYKKELSLKMNGDNDG